MLKKILAIVLTIAVALGLVGCSCGSAKIKPGKYKGVVVYHDDVEVTDDDVQQAINSTLTSDTANIKEKEVKKGTVESTDKVTVDFTGKIKYKGKKVAFDSGSAKDQEIDLAKDSGNFIQGFTSSIVGHKLGETFTAKMKFPETYTNTTTVKGKQVSLAGQPVWFTYKVKKLTKRDVPKLTDKYVKKNAESKFYIAGVTTVKALKKYMKRQMRVYKINNKVWNDIVKDSKVVKYDSDRLEKEKEDYTNYQLSQYQQQVGKEVPLSAYLQACQMSEKQWDKQATKAAKESLKQTMLVEEIAKRAGIKVTKKIYKERGKELALQSQTTLKNLEKQYGKKMIKASILQGLVREYIADNVKEKKGSEPVTTQAPTTKKTDKKEETTKKSK